MKYVWVLEYRLRKYWMALSHWSGVLWQLLEWDFGTLTLWFLVIKILTYVTLYLQIYHDFVKPNLMWRRKLWWLMIQINELNNLSTVFPIPVGVNNQSDTRSIFLFTDLKIRALRLWRSTASPGSTWRHQQYSLQCSKRYCRTENFPSCNANNSTLKFGYCSIYWSYNARVSVLMRTWSDAYPSTLTESF